MTPLWNDLRYALRQLRRSPGFAVIAILTLALGVGINTAIFSVVNGLLFSSLHVRQENRLRILAFQQRGAFYDPRMSLPEYRDLRDQTKNIFTGVFAEEYGIEGVSMKGRQPDRALANYVTGNYFQALGVRPLLGRFFLPSEGETPGADPVMVLGYVYWKKRFAGDPHVVGMKVSVDGHPVTIIGVAPRNFSGLHFAIAIQAFLPLGMFPTLRNYPVDLFNQRSNRSLEIYARLQPGVTPQQADANLSVIARRMAAEHPHTEKDAGIQGFPLYKARLGGLDPDNTLAVVSALFLGLAGLVLLLACVNVSNLLLVRASVREREMVIRSALGAQRSRLILQILTESILLALIGGSAGVGLGLWGSSVLSSVNLHTDLPLELNFGLDWHVLAFSAGVALIAGVIVGMVPALRLSRTNLNLILREGGRSVAGGGSKFRDTLVIVQVGSALMLLIVAGLFTRSLNRAESIDFGFNPARVLNLTLDPSEIGYNNAQSRDFYKNLLERIRALPGVISATTATAVPLDAVHYAGAGDSLTIPGYQPPPGHPAPSALYNIIAPQYFRTMQTPLLQGRGFTPADEEKGLYVAIVNAAMAKKFWPNQDPIGKQFTMGSDPQHTIQVVGVAKDARFTVDLRGAIQPMFYVPFLQHYAQGSLECLQLRLAGDPAAAIPEVEHAIHAMTPALPIFEVETMRQTLYSPNGLLIYQVAAALAAIMGTLGLILAIVGVYGVLSYVVSRKTNEIGIRLAMGAQRSDVLKMVYRQGLRIVGIGLAVGLVASFGAAHLMSSFIVVSATDPATYIGVSAILFAIALLACYVPAHRAMRIDPMQALREE
jgi:predicted permease